ARAGPRTRLQRRSADRDADRRFRAHREVRRADAYRSGVSARDERGMANEPRRRLLIGAAGTAVLALVTTRSARAARLLAVRVWPGPDYTRVTLEHDEPDRKSTRLNSSHQIISYAVFCLK